MSAYAMTMRVVLVVEAPGPEEALLTALDILKPGAVRTAPLGDVIAEITHVEEES